VAESLKANISWLALMKASNYVLPLITLPYLTRVLGLEGFGVLAIGMAIAQILFSLSDYGFSLLGPKLVVLNRQDDVYVGQLFSAITSIKFVLFLISSVCLFAILSIGNFDSLQRELWLLLVLPSFLQCLVPVWLFIGIEKMVKVTIINVLERICYALLIFSLIDSPSDITKIPLIMLASMAFALALSIYFVRQQGYFFQAFSLSFTVALMKQGWGYFYSRLTVLLFSKFNVIIVGSVLGEASAAIFSLAERIYNTGRSVASPLTDALYPYMVRTQNWRLAMKVVIGAGCVSIIAIPITYLLSEWFFGLFGEGFVAAADVFNVLIWAFSFSLISMLIGYPILGAMGYQKFVNRSVLFGAVVHVLVVFSLYGLNMLSMSLLAWSLVLTELIILMYRAYHLYSFRVKLSSSGVAVNEYGKN